jgi:aspartyl-tRNA(Asn)/glutamyl-tRNA(Gln) amidotransferase subunit B
MRYLGTCDGNMEEGSLRADVNVSVRKMGSKDFGTRCEIKNVNSIKFMQQAIQYEAKRQVDLLEEGKKIDQETRLFDTKKNETRQMRSKEDAHDYRYFPDPDLPPLKFDQSFVDEIKQKLPELPDDKKERLIKDYKLSSYEAGVLISDKDTSDYFEDIAKKTDVKLAINWVIGDLFAALNKIGKSIKESPISSKNLTKLIDLIKNNTISGRIAKEVFELMINDNRDPKVIVEEKGLVQESNVGELEKIIEKVLKDNTDKVAEYKSGKDKLFGFFVGSVIKESKGKANPALVNDILKKKLS